MLKCDSIYDLAELTVINYIVYTVFGYLDIY